jgi:hypothetical protein
MLSSRYTLPFADGLSGLRQRGEIGWGTVVAALFAAVVAADAGKRGMSAVGWLIGVFLLLIISVRVHRVPTAHRASPPAATSPVLVEAL